MGFVQDIKDVGRFEHILNVLFKHELGYLIDQLDLKKYLAINQRLQKDRFKKSDTKPQHVKEILEDLGGSFVKLGQLLSLRPDLIPLEYCKEFSKLTDDVKPFPTPIAKKIIDAEFHKPINKIFSSFSEKPIASASVGQVHEAVLKNGKRVAVKIQRPGIRDIFATDIDIMYHVAHLMEKRMPMDIINPTEIIKEFEEYTKNELDYIKEAKNVDLFYRNFIGNENIVIPRVYWAYTTSKVLALEYIDGTPLPKAKLKERDRKRLVKVLVDSVFKQIFEDGFFHADPHSGNILITKGNKLALLDFGIVGKLNEELVGKATKLCMAITEGDLEGISQSLLELGVVDENVNIKVLEQDIRDGLQEYYGTTLQQLNISEVFQKVMDIARKNGVRLPTNFVLLAKALVTVQGLAYQIDPSFRIIENVKPLITNLVKKKVFNTNKMIKEAMFTGNQYLELVKRFPDQALLILKRLREGRVEVTIEDSDIAKFALELDRSSNRIAYSLVIAALVVGSAFIIYADKGPKVYGIPLIAEVAIILSLFLGIILFVSVINERVLLRRRK